jgi:CreA protein
MTPILTAAMLGLAAASAPALAQDADEIFSKSTVWRPLTPDDKLVLYGIDDPLVDGVACHYTQPEKGGIKGTIGVAEEVSDISLSCRQIGPVRFKRNSSRATSCSASAAPDLQAHADRPRLRRQAQCARLPGLFGPADRGLAKNSTSSVPIMPWGGQNDVPKCAEWVKR